MESGRDARVPRNRPGMEVDNISFDSRLIDALRDPAVRDLAWVIGSPGLPDAAFPAYAGRVVENAWCGAQLIACASWLAALDMEPHPLHAFIAARPTRRLGHYFESLITFWLEHLPDMRIITTNLQVQGTDRTLGEYDFLLCNAAGEICHWEAAVKFYLQAEPVAEQRAFVGPGGRDRLDLKLQRVFHHQLDLGNTPAGRAALPQGLVLHKAQAFIKGYLFHAADHAKNISIPGISAQHLSGWWVRYPVHNLPRLAADSHWVMLPRLRWLAPVYLNDDVHVMAHDSICNTLDAHFATSDEAVQVAELQRNNKNEWREKARGFVVCHAWPHMNRNTP